MDPKLKQIRKRLYSDFPFYAQSALKIRTKSGEVAPLALNPAQEILDERNAEVTRQDCAGF